jgi:hypothetical protein
MSDEDLLPHHPFLSFILLTGICAFLLVAIVFVCVVLWAILLALKDAFLGRPDTDEESLAPQNNQT